MAHRPVQQRSISFALLLAMLFSQFIPLTATAARTGQVFPPPFPEDGTSGLTIILSDGAAQLGAAESPMLASSRPLGVAETQAVLDRLPALEQQEGDVQEFRLPSQSPPRPRTGEVVNQTFPPTTTVSMPAAGSVGPLEVLRYAPEGEIPLAPFLNVTFSQPMVPLATLEQLSAGDVPVILTPALAGVWKWLGTSTLSFEYQDDEIDRFPMATEFTAEVPASTMSATGGVLAKSVTWSFRTPPPNVVDKYPTYGPQPRDAIIFVEFDQRINTAEMLPFVSVASRGAQIDVRPASMDEIDADEEVSHMAKDAPESRWIAIRAVNELPLDATVNVTIKSGAPSAEGPLTTTQPQSFSFQTYAPLRVVEHRCSYYQDLCPPLSPFTIRFNNPLDPDAFEQTLFTIKPDVPGLFVRLFGDTVELSGATAGRTEYTVTVDGDVSDIFGQTLGEDTELTFRTTEAAQLLTGPDLFVTVDPTSGRPTVAVYSVNHDMLRVRSFAVTPDDWQSYQTFQRDFRYDSEMPDPPGREVWSEVVRVEDEADQLVETAIDLSTALGGETGHLILVVDDPSPSKPGQMPPETQRVMVWVQSTKIGIDAFSDHSEMVAWVTDLRDGAPLDGVRVALYGTQLSDVTDQEGVARLQLDQRGSSLLVASRGDDLAILPSNPYFWDEYAWTKRPVRDELRWYVFDDRQMYRPGESVHVKGWLRQMGGDQSGDIGLPAGAVLSLSYQVVDPFGNELVQKTIDLNEYAGFDLAFDLPENTNLGWATLYLQVGGVGATGDELDGLMYAHSFQVQEFRRPEFEVTTQIEDAGPHYLGHEATAAVAATYFAGGSLPNAPVNWTVSSIAGVYAPPNWPDFVFGKWQPWWVYWEDQAGNGGVQTFDGRTDATGSHYLNMAFTDLTEPRPYNVTATASVMDVNRQVWSASTSMLVHPAELYVGLRSDRTFVEQGDPLKIEAIVVDVDGIVATDVDIVMQAARLEWEFQEGYWAETEVDPQECTVSSGAEAVNCEFETEVGGEYRIRATVEDAQDRANRSELTRWVSGGIRPPARAVEQEEVLLVPDQESYQPGDDAEILVQAPFAPAGGLLTVSRNGVLYTQRFDAEDGSAVLRIPIENAHIPTLNVQVDVAGSALRADDKGALRYDLPPRPAYATGSLQLTIPPIGRALTVEIEPEESALEPGASTAVNLRLLNAEGEPVARGEVALVVVDEAVLALTGYRLTDPLDIFYQPIYGGVDSAYGRRSIVLEDPLALANRMAVANESAIMAAAAPLGTAMPEAAMDMAAMDGAEPAMAMEESARVAGGETIQVRSNFDPLALFAPSARTDADGRARVEFTLPDNLTRYRIMAVAVNDDNLFGSAEANLTARLPLMVRPSAPRFLNFGDRFDLPVVLQNQTDQALEVNVAVEVKNLQLIDVTGRKVSVPANDRVEVRFPAQTVNAGTARLRVAATAGQFADAADGVLPVYTPATTEAFATYGVVDEDQVDGGAVIQPLATPRDVFPQFGGLELNTSSTALQALTDAVIYLTDYPFEASEPLASRILGIAALRDVLTAFDSEGLPSPEELDAVVQRDTSALAGLQNDDGGFPIWRRGYESVPYYSIHVAHALYRAQEKGFDTPEETLIRVLDYLRQIDRHIPQWYGVKSRHMLKAYALYVRDLMGDTDTAEALRLYTQMPLDEQSLEAVAWIWQVLSGDPAYEAQIAEIRRHINNRAVETAGAANFTTSYGDDAYLLLHSDRRTDAVILDVLINDQPVSDLIPKVVNGLLAHQTRGRWNNTQENVFVLLALDRYFNTFEDVTPDFVARVWLGDTYVAEHEFRGRTTEQRQTLVPMVDLIDNPNDVQNLTLTKEGDGRLYYRLGLQYAPDDLTLDPLDMGFVVQRSYKAVDDPDDVRRDENGVWHIKSGARVRVVLTMVAPSRRYHVALVDPLPAGLEIINPTLAVSEPVPGSPPEPEPYRWWWYGPWYDHQNLRDNRAEAFQTLLWDGVYDYSYVARATTPGAYVVPPAKAEEMYAPEVFGRSGSDRVIVE